ncbi:ATP-grasp domain-containing protein [Autumnicola musiva]|uniref:ATP-grasp domain-containing protein n=1 Tax=Autumnicola musiva TaxID=3075589 RepID=A0ABU3D7I9_9FLAO|nr:ATP-grasp domain-containing protein [Zunongwangia sp. F117]MDT0677477.1 ATP-grasp domain-containing protein [Zunongwangia sp. F117]
MNILVTGAGALLGQGILRSLNEIKGNMTIHTCDPAWRSGGHWLGDFAHTIPLATDNNYIVEISRLISENNINLLFIGTDVELPVFAENKEKLESQFNLKIIVSNKKVIEIANNKYLTAKFLQENDYPFPYSVLSEDKKGVKELKEKSAYPYFAKPVDGARSKGIVKVENEKILDEITSYPNNLVIQEFISEEEGEFTSGCLVLDGKAVAVVTLKRDLRDGNTYRAYYEKEFTRYDETIKKIAESLGVEGPCNFQFRIRNGEPVIFEINARFSGTTPLRSFFGFNEVEAVVNHYTNQQKISQPELREGEVLRVWADLFIPKEEAERFNASKEIEKPEAEYHPFKK